MGHSYAQYAGRHELLHDTDIAIAIRCMLAESADARHGAGPSENLRCMFEYWNTLEAFPGPGCWRLNLDHYLVTDTDRQELARILSRAIARVKTFGDIVPRQYLNWAAIPSGYDFVDLPAALVLRTLKRFHSLLRPTSSA